MHATILTLNTNTILIVANAQLSGKDRQPYVMKINAMHSLY